jgi:hypothetical protein
MKKRMALNRSWLLLIVILAVILSSCKNNLPTEVNMDNSVPSLDYVSGVWVSADTIAMEPSIRNFHGQALLNRDMTSISWFVSAPYSGGHHTGTLKINGKTYLIC